MPDTLKNSQDSQEVNTIAVGKILVYLLTLMKFYKGQKPLTSGQYTLQFPKQCIVVQYIGQEKKL